MPVADLAIVYRDPAELVAYSRNTRSHDMAQIDAIRASIREFGFTNPVLLKDDGVTIGAGHARTRAALEEGLGRVPTVTLHGLTETQWRAYVIADNALADRATWNEPLLRMELGEIRDAGFELGHIGFEPGALAGFLLEPPGPKDPDEPIEMPAPVTVRGDLWLLGPHRLLCGDSTNPADVTRALAGAKPLLMVTDPPYGVEYDPNWRNSADRSTKIKGRKIGATAVGQVQNDARADWSEAWALFPGDVAYVWHAGLHAAVVAQSLERTGFVIRSQIIWNKQTHIIGRGDYHWKHEPCWYAVRKGRAGRFNRDGAEGRTHNTVWDIAHRASETGHGTQKPVQAMQRPIENNSVPGEHVYDPFSGSGTTIIAAQVTGRVCHAIELDPRYTDLAVVRWEQFTGEQAMHAASGYSYAEVRSAREG